jgi:hypothetical protein
MARIFVDGSRQHPDYTAGSSSPVARIESVFVLASIAPYRGSEVIKFDEVSGYPNTPDLLKSSTNIYSSWNYF